MLCRSRRWICWQCQACWQGGGQGWQRLGLSCLCMWQHNVAAYLLSSLANRLFSRAEMHVLTQLQPAIDATTSQADNRMRFTLGVFRCS